MSAYDAFAGRFVEAEIPVLQQALAAGFRAAGVGADEAALLAEALTESELRGNPTHGLIRFGWYVDAYRRGVYQPVADAGLAIERQASIVRVCASGALGYVPTQTACDLLVSETEEVAVALGLVSGIGEFGRASFYSRRIAEQGRIGIVMQNTTAYIKAPGGNRAVIGNNPMAYSFPGTDGPTFDASFTARSSGELHLRRILGAALHRDWEYLDSRGQPTTDPAEALQTPQEAVGGAKGFGIAVLIDLLAGALSGARGGIDVRPGRPDVGACILVINPIVMGTSVSSLEAAFSTLRDAVVGSGGRWLGERSNHEYEVRRDSGLVRIPEPITDEVNRTLEVLGAPRLASS